MIRCEHRRLGTPTTRKDTLSEELNQVHSRIGLTWWPLATIMSTYGPAHNISPGHHSLPPSAHPAATTTDAVWGSVSSVISVVFSEKPRLEESAAATQAADLALRWAPIGR